MISLINPLTANAIISFSKACFIQPLKKMQLIQRLSSVHQSYQQPAGKKATFRSYIGNTNLNNRVNHVAVQKKEPIYMEINETMPFKPQPGIINLYDVPRNCRPVHPIYENLIDIQMYKKTIRIQSRTLPDIPVRAPKKPPRMSHFDV